MPAPTYATTISALEELVRRAADAGDRAGYFPAMYLSVTRTIRRRAEAGRFQDGPRMERFVTSFAARYLEAHQAGQADAAVPDAWREAFAAAASWRPIILQHLLLGVNAHINLDLGVTASELAGPAAIDAVRADFEAVNDVLAELIDGCQGALGQMSPWLKLVDVIGGRGDEELIRFSLIAARRQAWNVAVRLRPLTGRERMQAVAEVDAAAATIARRVRRPGFLASLLLWLVRARERAAPAEVMRVLAAVRPADD
jgi:hypothetical protein